jgi:hypothetical protein
MSREFHDETLDALEVIIPNLNWRQSHDRATDRQTLARGVVRP